MIRSPCMHRHFATATLVIGLLLACFTRARAAEEPATADTPAAETPDPRTKPTKPRENLTLHGRVVFLADAPKRRFGIETDADAVQQQVALETAEGELYPLVKDARGRGFLLDARLRDVEMELLVRRHAGSPVVQVVRVYMVHQDGRYELDYWCDVCAIPMYEVKQCECCQGPIRLRERPAGAVTKTTGEAGSKP